MVRANTVLWFYNESTQLGEVWLDKRGKHVILMSPAEKTRLGMEHDGNVPMTVELAQHPKMEMFLSDKTPISTTKE
jgi:hypothetical protein